MFLPDIWPSYLKTGCHVCIWMVKNIDMSIMGIGTNILDTETKKLMQLLQRLFQKVICHLSIVKYIVEKLGNNPWSDMVRLARSEANAIAIRIARAATGKDKVALVVHG